MKNILDSRVQSRIKRHPKYSHLVLVEACEDGMGNLQISFVDAKGYRVTEGESDLFLQFEESRNYFRDAVHSGRYDSAKDALWMLDMGYPVGLWVADAWLDIAIDDAVYRAS